MFLKRFELFKLLGFPIRVDISWFFIAVVITWSLAEGLFPHFLPDLATGTYWMMGALGALGLFLSILLHELGHAVAARRCGMEMGGITLFIFGGVAEMQEEPPSAMVEFIVAVAGPIVTVIIAVVCALGWVIGRMVEIPAEITAVVGYLAFINVLLIAFNMIPAFPLDGGRVLRSLLWYWKDNLRWATRIASQLGAMFGIVLIVFGVLHLLIGALFAAVLYVMLGLFLRFAAQNSYQQVLVRKALEGESVRRFMVGDPITVPPDITLDELINSYIYRHYHKMYPVVDESDPDRVLGCITTRQVKEIDPARRGELTVADVFEPCSASNAITPDTDAMRALSMMNRTEASRLLVVDGDRLVGIVTLKDLLQFLSLKIELEEEDGGPGMAPPGPPARGPE